MSASMDINIHPDLIAFKDRARRLWRENPSISSAQAHEVLARSYGFKAYAAYRQSLKATE